MPFHQSDQWSQSRSQHWSSQQSQSWSCYPSGHQPCSKEHHRTARAQETKGSVTMEAFMFDKGHQVGYDNYKALIWILYPSIDLHHLPPSGLSIGKFIIKLAMNPSPSWDEWFNSPHRRMSPRSKNLPRGLKLSKIHHLL